MKIVKFGVNCKNKQDQLTIVQITVIIRKKGSRMYKLTTASYTILLKVK